MIGVWFLESAQDQKDKKKGELRSKGQREKSSMIVGAMSQTIACGGSDVRRWWYLGGRP